MYLARRREKGRIRYSIRSSVNTEKGYRSLELFDLGEHPENYVVYPGSGPGFYFNEELCDRLSEQGFAPDYDELEKVFWPFLDPETRRVIEAFTRDTSGGLSRQKIRGQAERCEKEAFHIFDMRRIHYLRFGELDQSRIYSVPRKIYRPLLDKSRDELEQQFMEMESVLRESEKKNYVYVIFDVPSCFSGPLARKFPEAVNQDKVDFCFMDALCRLNKDASFWADLGVSEHLHDYLVRYACWFFDAAFENSWYLEDLMQQFISRHRTYRPPRPKYSMPVDEAAHIMGITRQSLSKMTVKDLTRRYREMAKIRHPDQGGQHESFIKLNRAFEQLLRTLKAETGAAPHYKTRRG
ncbi:MAG: J domain-containing protein [Desulfobacterales bacterium]